MNSHLRSMINNKQFADCIITAGEGMEEEDFYAHRNILARNDYFKPMLVSQFAESKMIDGFVRISAPTVSPAIFRHVLEAIYCGRFKEDEPEWLIPNFEAVCAAASLYQCEPLRVLCGNAVKDEAARAIFWRRAKTYCRYLGKLTQKE